MPAYAPTAKEREIVEKAAGFGLPHDKICQLIVPERTGKPIDVKTLRAVFRAELDRGVAVADAAVANALYNNAVHSNNVAGQANLVGRKRACVGARRWGIRCSTRTASRRRRLFITSGGRARARASV